MSIGISRILHKRFWDNFENVETRELHVVGFRLENGNGGDESTFSLVEGMLKKKLKINYYVLN